MSGAASVLMMALAMMGAAETGGDGVLEARAVLRIQDEPEGSPYDWGPSVMRDDDGIYRMWWVRLGGPNDRRLPYTAIRDDGSKEAIDYPTCGDRIYYAESRDGRTWRIGGDDYAGDLDAYGPESQGPALVMHPAEAPQEFYHVGRPTVVKVDGTYYMYYEAPGAFVLHQDAEGKTVGGDEFQNQVFLATSQDGKRWTKHPSNENPAPVIAAPEWNKTPGHFRYGFGQPSVVYDQGKFVLFYVDSCTGPGDFMVRIEADNPHFRDAKRYAERLTPEEGADAIPEGAASRHAQSQFALHDGVWYLVRSAYGTGNLGLLASRGVFDADADVTHPGEVYPQLACPDPRGADYQERMFPAFLRTPEGELLIEDGNVVIFYSSARGFKNAIGTWDLFRCEVPLAELNAALGLSAEGIEEKEARPMPPISRIPNATPEADYARLPRFFSSDPDYDAFVNEYFMRQLSVDERGVYLGGGPILGSTDHMWVVEWDWWFFPWIDRGAMGLARQGGSDVDVILTTLRNTPVDRFGYTFGGRMHGEEKHRTLSNLPFYGWPWPKYDRNYTVDRPTGWDFNDLADGQRGRWSTEDVALESGYVDHSLVGRITGSAPAFISPEFDVDAFHVPLIELDVEYRGGGDLAGLVDGLRIYWATDAEPTFSEARCVTTAFSALPPRDYPVHYAYLVTDGTARFPLYFPMHLHPEWGRGGRRITRLRIAPTGPGAEDVTVALNYVRATYDTRLTTTNATLINATEQFVLWTGDYAFLAEQLPRLRRALLFLNVHMKGREKGLLSQEWFVGKDGIGGEIGHGLYGNYWDLLPGGVYDIESNVNYYRALRAMAELERVAAARGIAAPEVSVIGPDNETAIRYDETPESLDALAERVRGRIERRLWNAETGRFAKNLDANGELQDYGFLHFNVMALAFGVGTEAQRASILSWLNGREIPGDTSTGADIYRWRFTPRTTTKKNDDWYYWAWIHDRGINPDPTPYQWGNQMQDGGGVSFTSLFDLMARTHAGDQEETDRAFARTKEIQAWFAEVKAAGGEGRDFYRAYYDGHPERGLQQSPNPGGLGLDREFLSDGSLGTQFVFHAFLGAKVERDGELRLAPAVPSALERIGVENVHFRGCHLRIEAGRDYVSLEGSRMASEEPLTLGVAFADAPRSATVWVDGQRAEGTERDAAGRLVVRTALRPVRIEVR